MTKQYSIVFFGTGSVALESLKSLVAHFPIEAVLTKPDLKINSRKAPAESVNAWARKNNITTLNTSDHKDLLTVFETANFISRLGVVVDYGILIPQRIIESFPLGIVNSHFSLLPLLRGADPITFAILNNQKATGVSLMLINPSLDTGDLIAQKLIPINPNTDVITLTDQLIKLSNAMLIDSLPLYLDGAIHPFPQDTSIKPTYSRKISKLDGKIDWSKSADILSREIRAYKNWPSSYGTLKGKNIKIIDAIPVRYNSSTPGLICSVEGMLHIECGENSLLVRKIQLEGKPPIDGHDFIRGYKDSVGTVIS
jgi:methionyl-tRNA formyltransferase